MSYDNILSSLFDDTPICHFSLSFYATLCLMPLFLFLYALCPMPPFPISLCLMPLFPYALCPMPPFPTYPMSLCHFTQKQDMFFILAPFEIKAPRSSTVFVFLTWNVVYFTRSLNSRSSREVKNTFLCKTDIDQLRQLDTLNKNKCSRLHDVSIPQITSEYRIHNVAMLTKERKIHAPHTVRLLVIWIVLCATHLHQSTQHPPAWKAMDVIPVSPSALAKSLAQQSRMLRIRRGRSTNICNTLVIDQTPP